MHTNETAAQELSQSKPRLRKRLLSARAVLISEFRKRFTGKARFDFQGKRLISDDGQLALQWKLRPRPELADDYQNQQTTQGTVELLKLS